MRLSKSFGLRHRCYPRGRRGGSFGAGPVPVALQADDGVEDQRAFAPAGIDQLLEQLIDTWDGRISLSRAG